MPDEAAARALAIAKELEGVIGTLDEKLGGVAGQAQRTRRVARVLAVSVVLDILLSVACVFIAVNQAHVSHAIHESQLQSCAIGNRFRTGETALWDHVLAVAVPPPGERAADRKARLARLAAFRVYVHRQFSPVDCTQLYGKP